MDKKKIVCPIVKQRFEFLLKSQVEATISWLQRNKTPGSEGQAHKLKLALDNVKKIEP